MKDNYFLETRGPIAIMTLKNKGNLNIITRSMAADLQSVLQEVDSNRSVTVLILQSSVKKAFCAGADIKNFSDQTNEEANLGENYLADLYSSFLKFRKVLIAAVNGYALGGGFEIVLLCDIILASQDAKFGFPEITLGLFPGIGGTVVAQTIGRYRANQMILTGEFVKADEMRGMGKIKSITIMTL